MGIPYFVASIARANKHIIQPVRGQIRTNALLIDFNCFIHRYLDDDHPYPSIVKAINDMRQIITADTVYVALDGLVPYAKQVQQRYRRMRKQDTKVFDRNQISPETPWMKELLTHLPSDWIVSGTNEPGEGEHKLFQWLRDNYRRNVVIYGLDADLVLLALANKDLSYSMRLLREKNEFRDMLSSEAEWGQLDINALARVLPCSVDQFLETAVMCWGNDFLPPLAMFSLREDGYSRGLQLKGPNRTSADYEIPFLKKKIQQRNRPDEMALLGDDMERRMAIMLFDGLKNWEPVVYAYWKTVEWTLHYFRTNQVLDWSWYYPYFECPLVSTIMKFPRPTKFEWNSEIPFTTTNQLQFIMPQASLRTAKRRVKFVNELYDEESPEMRMCWMRKYNWESRPRISLPWNPTSSETEVVPL
jgi:hypothetical protein